MSVTLEWNDKGLQKIFYALSIEQQQKFHTAAIKSAAKTIAKIVRNDAKASGLSRTGAMEKNGWRWTRFGRVANSVTAGKLWRRKTQQRIRVFNTGGKRVSFSKSAPHAHLVILGHKKYIPNRDGTVSYVGQQPGVPIYQAAYRQSEVIFEKELEKSVARMIKRLNKNGKL